MPEKSRLMRVLHVVIQAGATNSQWNEHCLPVADERQLTVVSLLPASVEPDPRISLLQGSGSRAGALSVLRRALRDAQYDVIHVHDPAGAVLLAVACTLERRGVGDVMLTLHNSWQNLRLRNRVFAALLMRALPVVVTCSQSARETIPAPVVPRGHGRLEVVANGVDVDRVERALQIVPATDGPDAGNGESGVTVVTVGRLIPIKDQRTLLAAFARVAGPDDRLVVVGEGPLLASLSELARSLGVAERVQFPGLVPREDVYRLLGRADLFVSPSLGEGLPVSVLEAMAAGLPVVLSDIPPHREIVGATGVAPLLAVGDVDGFAAAIRELRDAGGSQRSAAGLAGRQLVSDQFSVQSMAEGYRRIYSRMARRAASSTLEVA